MKTGEMRHEFAGGEVRQDHAASVDKSRARAHTCSAPAPGLSLVLSRIHHSFSLEFSYVRLTSERIDSSLFVII